jgi:hypothetical protein
MAVPGPGAAAVASAQQVDYYAQGFADRFGAQAGQDFTAFAQAHPGYPIGVLVKAFSVKLIGQGLANAIGAGATGTLNLTRDPAVGSGLGIADTFKGLNLGGLLLRAAEVIAGLILLGIGLNAMLKGRPLAMVTGAAGGLAKVVP